MIPRRPIPVRGITPSESSAPPVIHVARYTSHMMASAPPRIIACDLIVRVMLFVDVIASRFHASAGLVHRCVDDGPQVDQPAEQEEPQECRKTEHEDCLEEAPL